MASDYSRALGSRLRAIRTQQRLSLHGVEEKSEGRWKAVVVGSYERGDRAVTVQRLAEVAGFYGVRLDEPLPDGAPAAPPRSPPPRLPPRRRGDSSWTSKSSAPSRPSRPPRSIVTPRPARASVATTTAGCC